MIRPWQGRIWKDISYNPGGISCLWQFWLYGKNYHPGGVA